jgi:membrane protein
MRHRLVRTLWQLVRGTVGICMRYRVTGLAAEAGFFALLSLPPLVLGLAGAAAWVGSELGTGATGQLEQGLRDVVAPFLTNEVVDTVLIPTLTDAIDGPRYDLISIGFLLSLWSGSRALNVYVDTIAIMYGLGGHRGIVRTRALSFSLYLLTLALGALTIPLVLVGPTLLGRVLPVAADPLVALYWPVVTLGGVALLATLYHVSTPVRTPWKRDLPGAALALVIWVLASYVLRAVIGASVGGTSIYGPLATPIVVLLWLYLVAIAVLVGAGLNAATDRLWPDPARSEARRERAQADEQPVTPVPEGPASARRTAARESGSRTEEIPALATERAEPRKPVTGGPGPR